MLTRYQALSRKELRNGSIESGYRLNVSRYSCLKFLWGSAWCCVETLPSGLSLRDLNPDWGQVWNLKEKSTLTSTLKQRQNMSPHADNYFGSPTLHVEHLDCLGAFVLTGSSDMLSFSYMYSI